MCVHKHAHTIICELHITKYFYYWLIFVSVDYYIFKVISLGVQQISFQGNSVSSSVYQKQQSFENTTEVYFGNLERKVLTQYKYAKVISQYEYNSEGQEQGKWYSLSNLHY